MLTDISHDSCTAYTFSDYVVWVVREENEVRLTFQNKSHYERIALWGLHLAALRDCEEIGACADALVLP
jgi:hypothetical protein